MAAFRSILRRFDDHQETSQYRTIERGLEHIEKPVVTRLATLTPADLKPLAVKNGRLWRDGSLARFGLIVPPEGMRSAAEFPREDITYPKALTDPRRAWPQRLGVPEADLEPVRDRKGTPPERYRLTRQPFPEAIYRLDPNGWEAFYRDDTAVRDLASQQGDDDRDGSDGRFAINA